MRILITGGSGLLAVNWAICRRGKDKIWLGLHQRVIRIPGTNSVVTDFDSSINIEQLIRDISPDLVIHTAGITDVEKCELRKKLAWRVNRDYAARVAKATYANNTKLIHISTDHLFDGKAPFLTEDDIPNPVNVYGASKHAAEIEVTSENPDALILRMNFFGWGPSYRHSFSDWILASLRQAQKIILYDNVIFSPLYVTEIVDAAHKLLASGAVGIYNLSNTEAISKYDFGLKLADRFGLDRDLIKRETYDKNHSIQRPLIMSLDNKKFVSRCRIGAFHIDRSIALLHADRNRKELLRNIEVAGHINR